MDPLMLQHSASKDLACAPWASSHSTGPPALRHAYIVDRANWSCHELETHQCIPARRCCPGARLSLRLVFKSVLSDFRCGCCSGKFPSVLQRVPGLLWSVITGFLTLFKAVSVCSAFPTPSEFVTGGTYRLPCTVTAPSLQFSWLGR